MTVRFGLLVFPNVQQLDMTGPYEVFSAVRGAEVLLVWKDRAPVTSSTGLVLTPTATFADCPKLDLLCVPGGAGVNPLMEDPVVLDFLRRQAGEVRYLTSVCTGSLVLGAAGLIDGRKATSHWNARDLLAPLGAIPTPGRTVQDGALITAGGVTSGIDFGLTVVAEMFGAEEAQSIQLAMEYAPAPPFQSGTPDEAPPAIVAATKQKLAPSRQAREAIVARVAARKERV